MSKDDTKRIRKAIKQKASEHIEHVKDKFLKLLSS